MGGAPMYLRWTSFPVQQGHRADIEAILTPFQQVITEQPGFRSVLLPFDAPATHVVSLTTWASHADAEAVTRTVRDAVQRALGELLRDAPTTESFEVYAPAVAVAALEPAPAHLDAPLA
jgi:heme-degrading monooxygenase HmoA